jgi:hypothetical protein
VVIILSFFITLWVGLFKVGATPAENTEFYGESFAPLALEAMPEFSVPGTIPPRGDGEPVPASVRRQFSERDGQLVFRGWITAGQVGDLMSYQDTLEWKAAIETLADAARPPEALRGKATYHADHESLGFRGAMQPEDRAALDTLFEGKAAALAAVVRVAELAGRTVTLDDVAIPAAFKVPEPQSHAVQVEGSKIIITGPISQALRRQMAVDWISPERVRPLPESMRQEWIAEINARGPALRPAQIEAAEKVFNTAWQAPVLVQTLNSAGVAPTEKKTAVELLAEKRAGVVNLVPDKPRGPDVSLNEAQVAAIEAFAMDSTMTIDELFSKLLESGTLIGAQSEALGEFLLKQPTAAKLKRDLAFELQRALHDEDHSVASRITKVLRRASGLSTSDPSLSREQFEYLLADYRTQWEWGATVDELFRRAHVEKYAWSGDYAAPGSPFWWMYQYVFQPLTATMFALLAFYVASAAFRAFRAKNAEATLLLATAFIVLIGRTPIAGWMFAWVPPEYAWLLDRFDVLRPDQLTVYIMSVFNTAGNRAIMIGIALGIAATSLKILLGVDRSYLGSGDE